MDNVSYRGDVNGDFVITLSEVISARDLTSLKNADCTNVIPSHATKCDTADLSGDGIVTLADLVAIRGLTSLKNYSTPDLPWTIDTSGIPAAIAGSDPIQVKVNNASGIGRPGIAVRFSLAATAEATLSGREYNPADDNIRDHASLPGAKEVLAITQTDFPGDLSGATEMTVPTVGTAVEMICTGTNEVTLTIDVLPDTLKGIPALSTNVQVGCSPPTKCDDGIDNDGDGDTDYPFDAGCTDALDNSEQGAFSVVGTYYPMDTSRDVFYEGGYAYLASNYAGLEIVDVGDPASPILAGFYDTPGYSRGVYVAGNYAYVADEWGGLQIVDVTNPYIPTFASSSATAEQAFDVFVSGDHAYVADYLNSLKIIDISNPMLATTESTLDTPYEARGVFVSADYAYVADYYTLEILNVQDPSTPEFVASATAELALDVFVQGNYAYVAADWNGLKIFDVTSATLPTLIASFNTPGFASGVFVRGDYAYVSDVDSLQVIDISDPASPKLYGSFPLAGGGCYKVHVSGRYAYVACQYALQIVDLETDPTTVPECGNGIDDDGDGYFDYPDDPGCTSASDISEYGTNECDDGINNDTDGLVDMDDPGCYDLLDPFEVGWGPCDSGWDEDGDGYIDMNDPGCTSPFDDSENNYSVECDDGQDNDSDFLSDMSDPGCSGPTDTSELGTNECDDGIDNDGDLSTDRLDPGCNFDPSGLTEIGECQDGSDNDGDTFADYPDDSGCYYYSDGNELGSNACDNGIDDDGDTLSDIGDPGCEGILSLNDETGECQDGLDNDGDTVIDFPNDPECASLADGNELDTLECDDGLDNDGDTMIDIFDPMCGGGISGITEWEECRDGLDNDVDGLVDYPSDPGCTDAFETSEMGIFTLAGSYDTPSADDVFVRDSYAYVADNDLFILDISTPSLPVLTGFVASLGAGDVYVLGDYAYVASIGSALRIVNIVDPANPFLESTYVTPDFARDIFVEGNYAYIACRLSGLEIVDITDPANPVYVGSYNTPGYSWGVYVDGNYAYVADDSSGLQIINVSDPANPTFAGSYSTPGVLYDVIVRGNYAYLANVGDGLKIVDISNPAAPFLVSQDITAWAEAITLNGKYAYVAGGWLFQFDISDPAFPIKLDTLYTWSSAKGVFVDGGYIYLADASAGLTIYNTNTDPADVRECNDLIDNDGDTYRDFHEYRPDSGCTSLADQTE